MPTGPNHGIQCIELPRGRLARFWLEDVLRSRPPPEGARLVLGPSPAVGLAAALGTSTATTSLESGHLCLRRRQFLLQPGACSSRPVRGPAHLLPRAVRGYTVFAGHTRRFYGIRSLAAHPRFCCARAPRRTSQRHQVTVSTWSISLVRPTSGHMNSPTFRCSTCSSTPRTRHDTCPRHGGRRYSRCGWMRGACCGCFRLHTLVACKDTFRDSVSSAVWSPVSYALRYTPGWLSALTDQCAGARPKAPGGLPGLLLRGVWLPDRRWAANLLPQIRSVAFHLVLYRLERLRSHAPGHKGPGHALPTGDSSAPRCLSGAAAATHEVSGLAGRSSSCVGCPSQCSCGIAVQPQFGDVVSCTPGGMCMDGPTQDGSRHPPLLLMRATGPPRRAVDWCLVAAYGLGSSVEPCASSHATGRV